MTTTANKRGLRAAAAERTAKAAQRTALPPKGKAEKIALAKEAVEESNPKKSVRKTGEVLAEARRAKEVKAEPQDKAARYATEFSNLGWKAEVTRVDGLHELVATRGNEALYLAWMKEAHVSGTSTYTIADRTVKVRNPAEAMRIAALKPEQAKAAQEKVSANKQFRRRPTGPTIRSIPFDVDSATDEEIVAALEAHQITWHNQYRVESETATVGRASAIHISRHARGHRIVSFVDPETGYRAFKLENLENVGRRVNLERIKQEILTSLMRAEKSSARRAA